MAPDPVLSLRSFNHEFTRFEKKHYPWSDPVKKHPDSFNESGEEPKTLTSSPESLVWRRIMASNFKIHSFKTGDSLHLKLTGDFDGSAAYELINTLEEGKGVYEIFINTNDLKNIYPFGRHVFQKGMGALKRQFNGITFVGKNKQKMEFD